MLTDQYTNPLARPLLIALQVVRFHLRECMGSSFPPLGSNNTEIRGSHKLRWFLAAIILSHNIR